MTTTELSHLELAALDPDRFAASVARHLAKLGTDAASSEWVYPAVGPASYFRDMLLGGAAAEQRLTRHREQMELVRREREQRARRVMSVMGAEYRVEPDRTPGYGGYFAPPAWLNQFFATANRPGRVLAGLIPRFPLPAGCASINIPILTKGTIDGPDTDDYPVPSQGITDSSASSAAAPFAGKANVSLQLLEQSPPGAYLDWALFMDLAESYDAQLELALIASTDGNPNSLTGVTQVTGINGVTYSDATPTGGAMYPYLGKCFAQIGDNRLRPPEAYMMRSARWAWLMTQEDTATLPFGLFTPFYLGSDDQTPDPIGALLGLPVFLDDAIPATQGAGANQDQIICLRPRDQLLLESEPQTLVNRERLSGSLAVGIEMHGYAAALTGRRPAGISVLSGTGLVVQSGE